MKRFLIACFVLIVVAVSLQAQVPPPEHTAPARTGDSALPKQIAGGVLNGKAISLPKPPFPAAARAVGASGAVTVQVLIDEEGNVVSANAVSGHPLLRAPAVQAAQGARFSPTTLSGQPVKVSGVITYNFVGTLYAAKLSFTLTYAERTAVFTGHSAPASLADQLPADWVQEKEILSSLTFEPAPPKEPRGVTAPAEATIEARPIPENPSVLTDRAEVSRPTETPKDTNRYTIKGETKFSAVSGPPPGSGKLDARSVSSLRNLISLVDARATETPSASWANEVGKLLAIFVAEIDDQSTFGSNLANIETHAQRAPSSLIGSSVTQVKEFVELYRAASVTEENREAIIRKAEMLANLRY